MKKLKAGSIRDSFFYNDEEIFYTIITNKKLKNLYITINPTMGTIVKNPNFPLKKIREIIDSKASWIYQKLKNNKNRLNIGEVYKNENKAIFLGEKIPLHVESLEEFYREKTKKIVAKEIVDISKKMSLYPTKVSFRKTKRRWGSCNYKNELSFTITLAQLPPICIRYIIIHELAHIKHKNHQKEFYKTIKSCMPDFKIQEKTLKSYSPDISPYPL